MTLIPTSLWRRLLCVAVVASLPLAAVAAAEGAGGSRATRPALMSALAPVSVTLDVVRAGDPTSPRLVAVGERGHILLSDDDGGSWRQVASPVSVTLTTVRFADARTGWAAGHGGVVLATTDGGETWSRRLDGVQAAALLLAEAEAAGSPAAIAAARRLVEDGADKPFLALVVRNARTILAFGAYGLALRSDDGGVTWRGWASRVDNPDGWHINAVAQAGDSILLAGEQGFLRLSTDGGDSFTALPSPYEGSLFSALALSPRGFLIFGLRGNALRSDDGGMTWAACAPVGDATLTSAARLPDGGLVVATAGGDLFAAPASCAAWTPLARPADARPAGAVAALIPAAGARALVIAGLSGLGTLPLPPSPQ